MCETHPCRVGALASQSRTDRQRMRALLAVCLLSDIFDLDPRQAPSPSPITTHCLMRQCSLSTLRLSRRRRVSWRSCPSIQSCFRLFPASVTHASWTSFFPAPPREETFLEPVYDPRNLENFGFPLRSLTLLSVEAYTLQQLEVESVSLQNYEFLGFRFL